MGAAVWKNGRLVRDDQDAADMSEAFKPWRMVPRATRPNYGAPPNLGDQIMTRGHLGFADQMQGAMAHMAEMNLANQGASLHGRDTAAGLEAAKMQAMAPVMAESIRASALAAMFGVGKGGDRHPAGPRYSSNIGQGINFYPKYHAWQNMPSMMAYARRE